MRRLLSGRLVLEQRGHEDGEAKNEGDGQIYQFDGQHDGAQWRANTRKQPMQNQMQMERMLTTFM